MTKTKFGGFFVTGEYISLYHHQRALLQQREAQKNDYISHLARDREEIQVGVQWEFILTANF